MATCKECIHFDVCEPYTAPDESYPEAGGCPVFKSKDKFVQVVRCKDCKNWEDGYFGYCTKIHAAMDYDGFCSNGERRATNESND